VIERNKKPTAIAGFRQIRWNLLCPLSKIFVAFNVMCSVNKDESWMFAHSARRENLLPDAYNFVLFGVRRIVRNFVNARSGDLISRLAPEPLSSPWQSPLRESIEGRHHTLDK
jgi:hypothetical protein